MISDIWLVVVKEYREVLLRQGGRRANIFNMVLIFAVFGVFMPLQTGEWWVQQPWTPIFWAWLPLFLVSALVADSFAGERERHTLETLLTTRLSDKAILFGKIAAAVIYGYGILLAVMVVSLVTINIAFATPHRLLFYRADVTLAVIVFGFLITFMVTVIGVMISLKATTVRQAGQALSLGILALLFFPGLIFGYLYRVLPGDVQTQLLDFIEHLEPGVVLLTVALVFTALDAIFLAVAMKRFKRSRLIDE
ncbi:MAG: ABC transporter permease subunit [Actinomycetota bacterium]|jgi:ABC-2 type transport system permease protein|nr:ABC transporter permease subunit [Actinomycetota bacterium]